MKLSPTPLPRPRPRTWRPFSSGLGRWLCSTAACVQPCRRVPGRTASSRSQRGFRPSTVNLPGSAPASILKAGPYRLPIAASPSLSERRRLASRPRPREATSRCQGQSRCSFCKAMKALPARGRTVVSLSRGSTRRAGRVRMLGVRGLGRHRGRGWGRRSGPNWELSAVLSLCGQRQLASRLRP